MAIFYRYVGRSVHYWWTFFAGYLLMLEQVLREFWPSAATWLDGHISAGTRSSAETWVAIFGIFLAGFLAFKDEHNRADKLADDLAAAAKRPSIGPNVKHDAFNLLVGDKPPFDVVETFPVGSRRRTVKVGVRNDGNGLLSNCEFYVKAIWPSWHQQGEIRVLLEKGFTLIPGETHYIDIAAFDEYMPPPATSSLYGKAIIICKEPGPFYNGYITVPVDDDPQKSQRLLVTLEARSTDASECTLPCHLWVDRHSYGPRLRLARADA